MLKCIIPVIFYTSAALASDVTNYLVSLKPTENLESFMAYEWARPGTHEFKTMLDNTFTFGNFSGFSGHFSKPVLERLRRCPLVAEITPDIVLKMYDVEIQTDCPRHLARLSQRDHLGASESFDYFYKEEASGEGVSVYVIDSGVEINHPEFEGRAKHGIDLTREGSGDVNGHGTHVAGIVGSSKYGVAKNVEIIEIKALDVTGAGSLSTIISALEFAVTHRQRTGKKGIVNLSLGAAKSTVLNRAVSAAVDTGMVVVVAAGNSNFDACSTSPASSPEAITVGAIDDLQDTIAPFSNWGECVDVFASGVYVASTNAHDYHNPQYFSGTSMAAPIISGLCANMMSEGVSPRKVKSKVLNLSTKDMIPRINLFFRRGSPNKIAFSGITEEDWDGEYIVE